MIAFDNSYARLPERFFVRQAPAKVPQPALIKVNERLAELLGIDPAALDPALLSGNRVPEGAAPLAQAYAGHQFGGFSPRLGDGRAILLGEVVGRDGVRRDIQFKGSGRTAFSRGGDGRAAVGPVLREYLLGEAMHALGIPTTRALAAVTTGDAVQREVALPGAVLTRVAASHLRVGTFQFFAAQGDLDAVRQLADYAIERHYPACRGDYGAFLEAVIAAQASLVAQWLLVGFIHGVMNTDNMAISGETIDYGPCAFMDEYDPATVYSSIDHGGRYAYGRQPQIAAWNLARLAEALLPLLDADEAQAIARAKAAIAGFAGRFEAAFLAGLRRKIGLATERDGDDDLAQDLLGRMHAARADWTLTFRGLAEGEAPSGDWGERWRARRASEPEPVDMARVNPLYIPRNHLVEEALAAATAGDYAPFETLLAMITAPYERRAGFERFALPPRPEERVSATFCGT